MEHHEIMNNLKDAKTSLEDAKNHFGGINRDNSFKTNIQHTQNALDSVDNLHKNAKNLHNNAQRMHKTLTPHFTEIKNHASNLHNSVKNGEYNKIPGHAEKLIVAVNKAHKELNDNKNLQRGGKKMRTRRSRTRRSRTRRSRTRRSRTRRSKTRRSRTRRSKRK